MTAKKSLRTVSVPDAPKSIRLTETELEAMNEIRTFFSSLHSVLEHSQLDSDAQIEPYAFANMIKLQVAGLSRLVSTLNDRQAAAQ